LLAQRLQPSTFRLPGQDAVLPASDVHVLPRDLGSLFVQRPLIQGESEEEYDDLLARVTAAVRPTDVIEAMWVKDIVDLVWESQRLRRLKASLLMVARKEALLRLLKVDEGFVSFTMGDSHSTLADRWLAGDKAAGKKLDGLLAERGLTLDSIMAQALSDQLRQVERIDHMIASADAQGARGDRTPP
jgi:hypothetical protein